MYGAAYLEWLEGERVKEKFGRFMESLDADERVLLEGYLRTRYRVTVTEQSPALPFSGPSQAQLLATLARQRPMTGPFGSIVSGLF